MLYTSDIEVCIRVTFKCVCELRAHRALLISYTQRIIFRYYSACYYALSAYLCRHTLLVLTNIRIRGSEMFSPAPQSLSLGRWRVSELGDDECEEVVDTSKLERRWRKGRRGDDECEAVVDTSKRERRWRKRVLWDDVELCGKFYEWDPVGCMGETTQLMQHVISK